MYGGFAVWRVLAALAAVAVAVAVAVAAADGGAAAHAACGIAEFACKNARCVRLDHYCDGRDHCGDNSDEPPHCTVCNRTYYGWVGSTYSLGAGGSEQSAPRVPFLCHLTLTAGGGAHGDIVQLIFDEFRVGRYEPSALDGCPDGYMQLSELGRPFTGGSWCGESAGYAVYYSETSTVTVSVKLFRARLGAAFHFRLRYKFLAQRDAIVRFGSGMAPLERGAVSPGTYCTRTFEECHRKPCRLQSPNYPGMYPRNVTCYWSLRQKDIPTCKHAMISVRQESAHKMQIKRSISMARMNRTGRVVRAWRECTGERDHLIFYDGPSTNDPVLIEYCGGDWLPPVVSRGPEMLVAFHSSPFSAPLHAAAATSPLRGFELDVDVIFADSDSLDYAREARRCEFHVKASSSEEETNGTAVLSGAGTGAGRGRRGRLHAPTHTLPPDTICSWTFHGRPGDLVWIYFSSYSQYSLVEQRRAESLESGSGERSEGETVAGVGTGGAGLGMSGGLNASHGETSPWKRLRDMLRPRPPAPPRTTSAPASSTASRNSSCSTVLRIWDGGGEGEVQSQLLGRFCSGPAVCARAALANATRSPRACGPTESYLSSATMLALAARSIPGTATHPLRFTLHYEFVDTRLGGREPPPELFASTTARASPAECARLFSSPGEVRSPRNVMWFGRGGARRLRCVYRVEAAPHQRVALSLLAAAFGRDPTCATRAHPHTGRPACASTIPGAKIDEEVDEEEWESMRDGADDDEMEDERPRIAQLRIYESPWPGYRVPLACVCDNGSATNVEEKEEGRSGGEVLSVTSGGAALEVELVVSRWRSREDHRHVYFEARWAPRPALAAAPPCAERRRLRPPGRRVYLAYPYTSTDESLCGETPYLLEARGNRSVFLRVWGEAVPPAASAPATSASTDSAIVDEPRCHTPNRILVYAANPTRLVKAICPGEPDSERRVVHMFSENWYVGDEAAAATGRRRRGRRGGALLVVWAARAAGAAAFSWMEVWPAGAGAGGDARWTPAELGNETLAAARAAACPHACPELSACAGAALWCDGAEDCPRGGDERGAACGGARRLLARLGGARVAGGAAGALLAALTLVVLLALAGRARRRRSRLAEKQLLAGALGRRATEELLFDASRASSAASS